MIVVLFETMQEAHDLHTTLLRTKPWAHKTLNSWNKERERLYTIWVRDQGDSRYHRPASFKRGEVYSISEQEMPRCEVCEVPMKGPRSTPKDSMLTSNPPQDRCWCETFGCSESNKRKLRVW